MGCRDPPHSSGFCPIAGSQQSVRIAISTVEYFHDARFAALVFDLLTGFGERNVGVCWSKLDYDSRNMDVPPPTSSQIVELINELRVTSIGREELPKLQNPDMEEKSSTTPPMHFISFRKPEGFDIESEDEHEEIISHRTRTFHETLDESQRAHREAVEALGRQAERVQMLLEAQKAKSKITLAQFSDASDTSSSDTASSAKSESSLGSSVDRNSSGSDRNSSGSDSN